MRKAIFAQHLLMEASMSLQAYRNYTELLEKHLTCPDLHLQVSLTSIINWREL